MKDFKTATGGTGTTSATRKIQFLCTMLRREALREFNVLSSQVGSTTNGNIKLIKEGLIGYFSPINEINNHKCAMRHAMGKPPYLLFKIFAARLTELNNYLPFFPGLIAANKMDPEELNKILLHAVPNLWVKKAHVKGWDFEGRSYKETCEMFKRMEIAEAIYKGGTPSQNNQ